MKKLGNQKDYWNSRAAVWQKYDVPLIPNQEDLDFHSKHLIPKGHALILGVTPELCALALEASNTVTAVDFAEDIITALRLEAVQYICSDWFDYFEQNETLYDTILTDGGLLSIDFPHAWQRMAEQIGKHLKVGGVFSARVYISTNEPPKENYENPNLERFVSSMGSVDENWMVHPKHGDYKNYDMRYAFPPEKEVLRKFKHLKLIDKRVPDYEEGGRFVSYAWQRL